MGRARNENVMNLLPCNCYKKSFITSIASTPDLTRIEQQQFLLIFGELSFASLCAPVIHIRSLARGGWRIAWVGLHNLWQAVLTSTKDLAEISFLAVEVARTKRVKGLFTGSFVGFRDDKFPCWILRCTCTP